MCRQCHPARPRQTLQPHLNIAGYRDGYHSIFFSRDVRRANHKKKPPTGCGGEQVGKQQTAGLRAVKGSKAANKALVAMCGSVLCVLAHIRNFGQKKWPCRCRERRRAAWKILIRWVDIRTKRFFANFSARFFVRKHSQCRREFTFSRSAHAQKRWRDAKRGGRLSSAAKIINQFVHISIITDCYR